MRLQPTFAGCIASQLKLQRQTRFVGRYPNTPYSSVTHIAAVYNQNCIVPFGIIDFGNEEEMQKSVHRWPQCSSILHRGERQTQGE